jgi:hypothetical protein
VKRDLICHYVFPLQYPYEGVQELNCLNGVRVHDRGSEGDFGGSAGDWDTPSTPSQHHIYKHQPLLLCSLTFNLCSLLRNRERARSVDCTKIKSLMLQLEKLRPHNCFGSLCKSLFTARAARVPSSIAPSIKLLHPTAQSELAKKIFPSLSLRLSRYLVRNSGPGKNLGTVSMRIQFA